MINPFGITWWTCSWTDGWTSAFHNVVPQSEDHIKNKDKKLTDLFIGLVVFCASSREISWCDRCWCGTRCRAVSSNGIGSTLHWRAPTAKSPVHMIHSHMLAEQHYSVSLSRSQVRRGFKLKKNGKGMQYQQLKQTALQIFFFQKWDLNEGWQPQILKLQKILGT